MSISGFPALLWRQRLVVAATIIAGLAVFALLLARGHKYSATASILAVSSSSGDAAVLDPRKDPTESAIAPQDLPNLLRSTTLVKRVAAKLHLSELSTSRLAGSISAKTSLGSDVIPVSVTDPDPQLAIEEVNAITAELQTFEQQIAVRRYDQLIGDLRRQLADRRTQLASIDQRITALTSGDPYVSYENGTAPLSARLVALHQQRDQVAAQMRGDAAAEALAAQRPDLARALAGREIIAGDPLFQNLRGQFGKDLAQLDQTEAGYTSSFPGLPGLRDQVSREQQSLSTAEKKATADPARSAAYVSAQLDRNKAEAALANDRAQLSAIDGQIAQAQQHLTAIGSANMDLASLRRERESGDHSYGALSDRLATAEADRAQAASIQPVVVLDEAATAQPTLLSRPAVIATAIGVATLWLAITLAFLVDGADGRLRSRTTIEELYGSPVLTTVG